MKQYLCIILGISILMLTGCTSTVRFTSNPKTAKENATNEIIVADTTPAKAKQDLSKFYDTKAKTIIPPTLTNANSKKIIAIAEKWLGVSYLYGGNTKAGIDCSGFVKNVFKELGINLPRTSADQFSFLKPTANPYVGDLVFFKKEGRINHVGIYLGNDMIIHSSRGRGVVKDTMKGTSLERTFAGYRKVM